MLDFFACDLNFSSFQFLQINQVNLLYHLFFIIFPFAEQIQNTKNND
jgi:hypothetical protein